MIVLEMHPNHLKVKIATGKFKGHVHFLFRIQCNAADVRCPFQLNRFQFPVLPGFSITINKSQGQTLRVVGLDLTAPVFSHGQLYVALSRASSPDKVFVNIGSGLPTNVVYHEILKDM